MNIYDFDGTIYDGDSTLDFFRYCLTKHPRTWLGIFNAIWGLFLYMLGMSDKTKYKERFFSFLRYIRDIDSAISAFWKTREDKIQAWYLEQKQDTDIIISASPEFLLFPICQNLGVRLMASLVDKHTGIFTGKNCHGEEKVRRLSAEYPHCQIQAVYSDSLSDAPLVALADKAFLVKGKKVLDWTHPSI
jgi:HAD superfamily phosphoserine phosphatase-like hydrolase